MKRFSRLIAMTITAALTAASVLPGDSGHMVRAGAMESGKEPVWPGELVRTVADAKEAYERSGAIPPELSGRLTEARELLLPTARKQLSLQPPSKGGTAQRLSPDWRFWAALAQLWNDSRLLTALLDWTAAYPLEWFESEPYVRLVAETLRVDEQELVLRRLDGADRKGVHALLYVMRLKGWIEEGRMDEWLAAYKGKPQQDGIVDYILRRENGASLIRLYEKQERVLTPVQKLRLVRSLTGSAYLGEETKQWLRRLAAATDEPAVEQAIDQMLVYSDGDEEAAERLYRSGTGGGFAVALNGRVEKALTELHPSGELAEGVRRYEAIRGKPYFYYADDGWYSPEGKDYDHPEEAIGLWLDFLKRYPNHPAADDAAYRLARCYQMSGDGESAMVWMNRAARLGDRDLGYDASGLLLFILDVEMSSARLEAVRPERLPAWMKPWLDYTRAVESIREKRYREAARLLRDFIDAYSGKDLFEEANAVAGNEEADVYLPASRYPFWEKVSGQLQLTERMAKLAEEAEAGQASGAVKAQRQYALAAAIYREPLLYYNHLWRGERQSFFWLGGMKSMNYYEPLDRYIGRFNHLVQAMEQFAAIDLQQAGPSTAAKTLFSIALSYSKLTHYGEEVSYYMSGSKLNEKVLQYAGQLVAAYPESELADDALMLMYAHTKDRHWLEQAGTLYPEGDQAAEAVKLLEQLTAEDGGNRVSYDPGLGVRFEKLQLDDRRLPFRVRQWAEVQRGLPYRGTMADGDWVYVLVRADEGKALNYMTVGSRGLRMIVTSNQSDANIVPGRPAAMLARVKSKFVHDGEWEWQMYSE